ncbi:MAG: hypothetical protein IPQ08_03970 [Chitinophagaceae bacterium]|nr:hypothetical protein [Chitinophagaceae bacterium]
MARSHHRKKHRTHLQQFKHSHEMAETRSTTKASSLFAVVGALTGGAVGFFASQGGWIWIGIGLLVGAAIGYFLGKKLD